jgi:PEP-CTERM motif
MNALRPAALLFAALLAPQAQALSYMEASGANAAAITPIRDAFRAQIGGGTVAGAAGSFGGLRREINWDAVPATRADPNFLPANFFNVNSPRGAVFSTPGSGFLVSSNVGEGAPLLFGFGDDLAAFSAQRIFSAVGSTQMDVQFFVPGTTQRASTSAFGVIFTDVETAGATRMQFFDLNDQLIGERAVLTSASQGFSFLGGFGENIGRVRIFSGENTILANGLLGNGATDLVAMDDFLYAEPLAAVPEPGTWALMGLGLATLLKRRRRA